MERRADRAAAVQKQCVDSEKRQRTKKSARGVREHSHRGCNINPRQGNPVQSMTGLNVLRVKDLSWGSSRFGLDSGEDPGPNTLVSLPVLT